MASALVTLGALFIAQTGQVISKAHGRNLLTQQATLLSDIVVVGMQQPATCAIVLSPRTTELTHTNRLNYIDSVANPDIELFFDNKMILKGGFKFRNIMIREGSLTLTPRLPAVLSPPPSFTATNCNGNHYLLDAKDLLSCVRYATGTEGLPPPARRPGVLCKTTCDLTTPSGQVNAGDLQMDSEHWPFLIFQPQTPHSNAEGIDCNEDGKLTQSEILLAITRSSLTKPSSPTCPVTYNDYTSLNPVYNGLRGTEVLIRDIDDLAGATNNMIAGHMPARLDMIFEDSAGVEIRRLTLDLILTVQFDQSNNNSGGTVLGCGP